MNEPLLLITRPWEGGTGQVTFHSGSNGWITDV